MRILFTVFTVCLLAGCERVNFVKREGLSVAERARAIAVLHKNAAALNAGDIEALERTIHSESPEVADNAQEQIVRFLPTVTLRGLKVVAEKQAEIVVEYEQTVEVKRGSLPFGSVVVQTTLARDGGRWGIFSTRPIRFIR